MIIPAARVCIAILLTCGPLALAAQEAILIPDQITCACRLRVERVATLSDVDGRAGLSGPLLVERAGDGRYLVVPGNRQGAILLFDGSGRYVRTVGGSGSGPDEFRAVLSIRPGQGDSTVVLDAGNGRLAMLDSELKHARVVRTPVIGGGFGVLEDGRVLIMMGIPRQGAGLLDRVRVFSPTMEPLGSFLKAGPAGPTTAVDELGRRMAVSPGGLVAIGHVNRYRIEIWDAAGLHLRTLRREPTWFPPGAVARSANEPLPTLATARWDSEGRLWTVSHVADPRWREALGPRSDPYGREVIGLTPGRLDRYQDTVVELIDPDAGLLLGSIRIDARLELISDDGFAASYREDEVGLPFIDIWRFEVVR